MTLYRVSLAVLALGTAACGNQLADTAASQPAGRQSTKEEPQPASNEGYAALMDLLNSKYIKCGDTYSTKWDFHGTGFYWEQLTGLDPQVTEEELSTADQLNRLTFKGSVDFGDEVARRSNLYDHIWKPWEVYSSPYFGEKPIWSLQQQNGGWTLVPPDGERSLVIAEMVRPTSCDEIPPDLPR